MIKDFSPTDWRSIHQAVTPMKVASAGLRGKDLDDLIRGCGADTITNLVKTAVEKRLPGECLALISAMGATEKTGPNRNGDGFKIAMLRKYHPTFVTVPSQGLGAYWYRDHKHDDPEISYGIVKDSMYDDKSGRVFLVTAFNATKEAADRNKGLIADKEMDCIEKNADIPVSMAIRVPHDICASCGHQAKNRSEYCDEHTCKHGGCRNNLGRVYEDGFVQHVDNPSGSFFDTSSRTPEANRPIASRSPSACCMR